MKYDMTLKIMIQAHEYFIWISFHFPGIMKEVYRLQMEFYEEAYFYNRQLTLTFTGMEARYR
jgi:hypothetical protein